VHCCFVIIVHHFFMPSFSAASWFLTGPTASGKSAVGVELAQKIDAEIISLDSVAVYRGMDIGAAKPTAEQRQAIPHHLVDILEPSQDFSLAQYLEAAELAAAEIASRGKPALFVGGTPLYLKGLLRGIFEGPAADWDLRHRLAAEAAKNDADWLHKKLAAVDPTAAARLHPNDTRRLIRAIEVFEKTGRPISQWQQQFDIGRPAEQCRVFVLDWPKPELYARIDCRVEAMFAAGLVEEVRRLLANSQATDQINATPGGQTFLSATGGQTFLSVSEKQKFPSVENCGKTRDRQECLSSCDKKGGLSRTARQAVGYREVIEHLEGRRSLADTLALVQLHTRQLAKRQCTWFRSLSECRFIPATGDFNPAALAEECRRQE
jgi:tRNA dimethylallyltransferase